MTTPKASLVIVSAPSGAGKTSLTRAIAADRDDATIAISHTTREQRAAEVDGKDYHFVTREAFMALVAQEGFLEHAEVFGRLYGTSKQAVKQCMENGQHVLLDIDWQGARLVRDNQPNCVSVFILPPSSESLENRLRARQRDDDRTIAGRMAKATSEISHYGEYDYVIVNDDFDAARAELEAIIDGRGYSPGPADENIATLVGALSGR